MNDTYRDALRRQICFGRLQNAKSLYLVYT